jgi:hypothetical protein
MVSNTVTMDPENISQVENDDSGTGLQFNCKLVRYCNIEGQLWTVAVDIFI